MSRRDRDLPKVDKTHTSYEQLKMYYVYVLQSRKDKNLYIGYSDNLKERLKAHNSGKVRSTKSKTPFDLVYYEAYRRKPDATKREYKLKTSQQREFLRIRLKYSLE